MHDTNLLEDQPIAWTPTPKIIERAQLTKFMRQIGVSTWDELYVYSINDVEKFTEEVIKFLDIKFDPPYEKLLDTSDGIEFPQWFTASKAETRPVGSVPHAGLNITTMCLDRWQTDEMKDQPAVIWEGEDGAEETLSYEQLLIDVEKCAAGLRANDLGKGDAIGIHLPMIPETVVALLAINRIGAIAVPVFSGYGVEAIASRMDAVGAKALFAASGFSRRGKLVNSIFPSIQAAGKCPAVKMVFLVGSKQLATHRVSGLPPRPIRPDERVSDVEQAAARHKILEFMALSEEEKAEYRRKKEVESNRNRDEFFGKMKELGVPEEKIAEIIEQMVHQPSGIGSISMGVYDIVHVTNDHPFKVVRWTQLVNREPDNTVSHSKVEPTSAEDPLIILYTSGTTGKPKGIAHTHASFPIKAAQDMAFGTDVGKGTRISWYTDIGWMMGPWLIYGALINGATICIYDGAPDYPTPDRMWEFCAKHKVEVLGISPTLVRSLSARESERPASAGGTNSTVEVVSGTEALLPPAHAGGSDKRTPPHGCHDLSHLRIFASTGEPWNPAPWWWLFEKVGDSKVPIINYSGGTEISGGILMGNPLLPIKPCSFPAPCPGMDVDILDENGKPVAPGKVGELVIKQPWIGMARGFWQEKERYLDTYWRRFKNIWVHGDWAMRDADGHWFILGRSDDTLKVAGKRVGPAEVESILVSHPSVVEAAVIGVPDELKGTAMVGFCVLSGISPQRRGDAEPEKAETLAAGSVSNSCDDDLVAELKSLVARDMGKPLTPSKIHFVSALPKTRNAKVMRRVIRAAYLGEDPGDLSALEDPAAVDEIMRMR